MCKVSYLVKICVQSVVDQDNSFDEDQEQRLSVTAIASKRPRVDVHSSSDCNNETVAVEDSNKGATIALPLALKRKAVKEGSLPNPFPLPLNYRADIETGLRTGIMSKEAKSHFFSKVASSMFQYKKKPTKEEYTRVAQQLIAKYPFLEPPNLDEPLVS